MCTYIHRMRSSRSKCTTKPRPLLWNASCAADLTQPNREYYQLRTVARQDGVAYWIHCAVLVRALHSIGQERRERRLLQRPWDTMAPSIEKTDPLSWTLLAGYVDHFGGLFFQRHFPRYESGGNWTKLQDVSEINNVASVLDHGKCQRFLWKSPIWSRLTATLLPRIRAVHSGSFTFQKKTISEFEVIEGLYC